MKYHLVTLGCQMNKSDSERVRTVLGQMGYTWTDHEDQAELLGILACSVRQKSIDKVYSRIHKWNTWKNHHNLITFISGCVLPADREKFLKLFDLIFDMRELPRFPGMVSQYGIVTPASLKIHESHPENRQDFESGTTGFAGKKLSLNLKVNGTAGLKPLVHHPAEEMKRFWSVKPTYTSVFEAFIPIQNGCDKFCTFCAVPYTRGREISRPSEEILAELKLLVEQGFKSITLLGQNVNSYGLDKKGDEVTFPRLLRMIGEFGNSSGKNFWVYFTSPHPRDMTDEVISTIAEYRCLARQIHLPLQSGDDKVLIRMNRKHTVDDYRKIMHSIRRIIPEATVFTDIIVGFTGETDVQFENTRKAMEAFRFNMAYIAKYSPRPGAASSHWEDDIPARIKTERLHILTEELTKHTAKENEMLAGKRMKVLVTGRDRRPGYLSALTEGKIVLRFASADESLIGRFVEADILAATDFALEASLVRACVEETV